MKLSQFKNQLSTVEQLNFVLPNGTSIPAHFHITEAGLSSKHFIDCGGTIRTEKKINLQLWVASDLDHRLHPEKLVKIVSLAEPLFNSEDLEIEIEYQGETVGKYGLEANGNTFVLTAQQTDCLAKENCGVPEKKEKLQLADLPTAASCCSPNGNCC